MNNKFTVTQPLLPPLEEFIPYLEDIWQRKWLTNNGLIIIKSWSRHCLTT